MTEIARDLAKLNILGENIALDFANTVGWHESDDPAEWIPSYGHLVEWSYHAGILSKEKSELLLDKARSYPDEANQIFENAIVLREAIYRIFKNMTNNHQVNVEDLDILNSWTSRAFSYLAVKPTTSGFELQFHDTDELDQMLWSIVRTAADLLTSAVNTKLKQCEGGKCGWLFIDTSKNKSRRWCSMEDCGNRAKALRFYKKKKSGQNQ